MEQYEKIWSFVRYNGVKVVCICKKANKRKNCARAFGCQEEPLLRDRLFGLAAAFKNKEGR